MASSAQRDLVSASGVLAVSGDMRLISEIVTFQTITKSATRFFCVACKNMQALRCASVVS